MIKVEDVTKSFGDFKALDHTSLHVKKGAVYGLVGPNGAGKSTIIRHITGVYRPDSGSILIDGQPVFENPAVKKKIAYIPDDLFYFLQADTLEMKRFYKGIYKDFDEKLFEKLREFFPTIDVKRSIRRLSKGMQKQVAFWLAICSRPELMVLDEPVDGLDPVMRRQIWGVILSEAADHHTTGLVSSHNLRELEIVPEAAGIKVVISGHTHRFDCWEKNGVLYGNPGACGHRRFGLPLTMAWLEFRQNRWSFLPVELKG